ncbi:UbiH/UbiF/VisC/COQ6 family ubiquinone biosynthesis hydroxylase [Colwellia psychrerythraea]|uniref:Ubiquinone biosynthesis hydroxylase, UbiH/UbiF/VisC/COQ6 family n=1 Tax=Colwellia psychrerythraea TaxID=28229 RepID=A0A099KQE8_COLPS|nr:UbiH/UbiF/VisC/COQ6 family ubiquinone biosynthesis hydroxylase [Colwellia psychrerythraea]KGJ91898.1 Ubiquinone biosynthesis hydroxylase, UbiH/UbiF/VisC/COQ6 family [Colwellia psychrerythraea]
MQKFDVLIVGAGMVGLTLALALRKSSQLKIALVDTSVVTELDQNIDVRVSAINVASKNIFANLGIWSAIENSRAQDYQHMHVWDKAGVGKLDFSAKDSNSFPPENNLGWIIENKVIRHALWQEAQLDEGIHFFTDNKLASISHGDSEVFATFAHDASSQSFSNSAPAQPIIAKLVVGADGANSWVRQQMDMAMIFKDYDHHAIVATVACPQGHKNTAWQVFLPTGPLAFLPLKQANGEDSASDLCSIVYSTSPDDAQRLTALGPIEFAKELTAASDGKLGDIELKSECFTYPLTMRLAQDFVKERVVLIGDAAHTIHPLAGQGVNLGLLDAAALAQTLTAKLDKHEEITTELVNTTELKAFSRWRKSEATEMIAAMAGIKQAFTPQSAPIQLLRGVGMNILNNFGPAKNRLIAQALGAKADLPELAYQKDKL